MIGELHRVVERRDRELDLRVVQHFHRSRRLRRPARDEKVAVQAEELLARRCKRELLSLPCLCFGSHLALPAGDVLRHFLQLAPAVVP